MKSWQPIVSAAFCYDSHSDDCKYWYDRWLLRGGQVARDCVYFNRAQDMQDHRSFDEQVKWKRMEGELRIRRLRLAPVEKVKARTLRVVR